LHYSFEPELLGTSGALNNFKNFFNETFFVIYGDNITSLDLTEMLRYHKSKKASATLYLYREKIMDEKTTLGCVVISNDNIIKEIIENPDESEKEQLKKMLFERKLTNAGVYILEPEILKLIPEGYSDFAKDIFPRALEKGCKLYGFQSDCYFKEIGQMQRYLMAKKDIESGKIKFDFLN